MFNTDSKHPVHRSPSNLIMSLCQLYPNAVGYMTLWSLEIIKCHLVSESDGTSLNKHPLETLTFLLN